jgi:type I restriction enzyme S subunit
MRKGWTETSLGEIATLTMGRTPSRSDKTYWTEDLAYPFCTIADMDGKFIFPKREGVTIKAIQDGKARIAPTGTLLMSFKLTIGRMGFAGQDIFPNEAIVSITPDSAIAMDTFLYYLLGFQDLTAGSGRAIKGETLNSKSLSAIPISLPPLTEQKRIVDVVSSVDAYIDALQQQSDSARTSRNAVLHDLLSAGGDDWTKTTLGDISSFVSKRESPKELALDTSYVGLEHVEPKTTLISNWGSVESVSSSVTPFEPEDTLFGRLRPYLHKVAFADFPGVCSPEILVLRSSAKCESMFLYLLCSLESTVRKCVEMSAGTRMPRTSTTDLASIEVQLPPLAEQKRIVELVSSMDEVIQSTEQAVINAKALRTGLLSDLLSGNHEIPASYDSLLGAA